MTSQPQVILHLHTPIPRGMHHCYNTYHVLLFFLRSLSLTILEIPQWQAPIYIHSWTPRPEIRSYTKEVFTNTYKMNEWMPSKSPDLTNSENKGVIIISVMKFSPTLWNPFTFQSTSTYGILDFNFQIHLQLTSPRQVFVGSWWCKITQEESYAYRNCNIYSFLHVFLLQKGRVKP